MSTISPVEQAGTVLLGKSDVFFYDSRRALANCQN
jgi:hypothetical protein